MYCRKHNTVRYRQNLILNVLIPNHWLTNLFAKYLNALCNGLCHWSGVLSTECVLCLKWSKLLLRCHILTIKHTFVVRKFLYHPSWSTSKWLSYQWRFCSIPTFYSIPLFSCTDALGLPTGGTYSCFIKYTHHRCLNAIICVSFLYMFTFFKIEN